MIEIHFEIERKRPAVPMESADLIECLTFCAGDKLDCMSCKRWGYDCGSAKCVDDLMLQAAAMIRTKEARIAQLEATLKKYAPCSTCKHKDQLGGLQPCRGCLHNIEERPGWELREE